MPLEQNDLFHSRPAGERILLAPNIILSLSMLLIALMLN